MRITHLLSWIVLASLAVATPALGADKDKAKSKPAARAEKAAPAKGPAASANPEGKAPKARVHTFSGLDVEGKLKTPQLLYFRSRVKQELDTSGPERRSFMKELAESADAKGL